MIPDDGGSAQEREMVALIRGHPGQKRKSFRYDARLGAAARAKARDMAKRGYFGHTDPDGFGSNWHIARTGYRLPDHWLAFKNANQGESILAGFSSVPDALAHWLNSSSHRSHLLALNQFYADQTQYGIGYHSEPGSKYGHYWVLVTAPPEQ